MKSQEFVRPVTTMNQRFNYQKALDSSQDYYRPQTSVLNNMKNSFKKNNSQPGFPIVMKSTKEVYESPIQNLGKKKPKNIIHDKEKQYEEILNLKSVINILKLENHKLRTKNLNLEREANKYEKMIEQSDTISSNFKESRVTENALILNLRKQLKDCIQENKRKENELISIKKNFRFTKINELEIEIQKQSEESSRLRNMLQQALKINGTSNDDNMSLEEKYLVQMNTINTLKKDNIEMAAIIKKMEEEIYHLKNKNSDLERINQKTTKEKNLLRKYVNEKERELDKKNEEKEYSAQKKNLNDGNNADITIMKLDIEKKQTENQQLISNLKIKEIKISELEKKIKDIHHEYQDKLAQENKERQMIILKGEKEKDEYNELFEKYQNLIQQKSPLNENIETPLHPLIINEESHKKTLNQPEIKKKLPKINAYEVDQIGIEIRYGLLLKRIPFEDIDNFLFTKEINNRKKASISEMQTILKEEPFNVKNEKNLLLVSRYLIENNMEDHVILDLDRTCETIIIKSIFKKLVGHYTLLEMEEEKQIYDKLSAYLMKFKQGLLDSLIDFSGKRKNEDDYVKDTFNCDDLKNSLNFIEADFSTKENDYLKMQLFKEVFDLNKLPIKSVIDIFDGNKFEKNCTFAVAEILSPKHLLKKMDFNQN